MRGGTGYSLMPKTLECVCSSVQHFALPLSLAIRLSHLVFGLADRLGDARGERVVAAAVCGVRHQLLERLEHLLLHLQAVRLGHAPRQRERRQVAPHAHAHGGGTQPQLGEVQPAPQTPQTSISPSGLEHSSERMSPRALQTLREPIVLLSRVCFQGGGFTNP
jgi:hypothetical protein